MKTLNIKIPEGFQVDCFNKETGEVSFKKIPKTVFERIQNFNDVIKDNGLTQKQFDKNNTGIPVDEIGYRECKLIVKTYNEGWIPDFNDSQPKWFIYWNLSDNPDGSSGFRLVGVDYWSAFSGTGSRLCFETIDKAKDAANKFIENFRKFHK